MALDPLKFSIGIQDDATKEINKIQGSIDKMKDATIKVKVEGIEGLQSLVQMLSKNDLSQLGKGLSEGMDKAAKSVKQVKEEASNLKEIASLRDSVTGLVTEINRAATAFSKIGNLDTFTQLQTQMNSLLNEVNGLVEAMAKMSGALHIDKSAEQIAAYESRIEELKRQIISLEVSANKASIGVKSISEEKGSEARQNANLSKLNERIKDVTDAYDKLNSKYEQAQAIGMRDESIEHRLQQLKAYREELEKAKSMDLSKAGSLSQLFFNDENLLTGKHNKGLFKEKDINGFVDAMDAAIQSAQRFANANAQTNTELSSLRSTFANTTSSASQTGERVESLSFSFVALQRNIQELIKAEHKLAEPNNGVLARLKSAIEFGDARGRDTNQLKEQYEWARKLLVAIQELQNNRFSHLDILGVSGGLKLPMPDMGDFALLGGHWTNFLDTVNQSIHALEQMDKAMRLTDGGMPNVKRNQEEIDQYLVALKKVSDLLGETAARKASRFFDATDILGKKEEVDTAIEKLKRLRQEEDKLRANRWDVLRTAEQVGGKAPAGLYVQSLLGSGAEESRRVDILISNADRIKKALETLHTNTLDLRKSNRNADTYGVDITQGLGLSIEARGLIEQLSKVASDPAQLQNKRFIDDLIQKYRELNSQIVATTKANEQAVSSMSQVKVNEAALNSGIKRLEEVQTQLLSLRDSFSSNGWSTSTLDSEIDKVTAHLAQLKSMLRDTAYLSQSQSQVLKHPYGPNGAIPMGDEFQAMLKFGTAEQSQLDAYNQKIQAAGTTADAASKQITALAEAITRAGNAGRNTTSMEEAMQRLNFAATRARGVSAGMDVREVEARTAAAKREAEFVENLVRAENKLTIAREKANAAADKKQLQRMEKMDESVNAASNQWDVYNQKLTEAIALRERAENAHVSTDGIDAYISHLQKILELLNQIIAAGGTTPQNNALGLAGGLMTGKALSRNEVREGITNGEADMKRLTSSVKESEHEMEAAKKAIKSVSDELDKLGKIRVKLGDNNLGTSEVDEARQKLENLLQLLQLIRDNGGTKGSVANAMALSDAFSASKTAIDNGTNALKAHEKESTQAAAAQNKLVQEEQRLFVEGLKANDALKQQSDVLSQLKMMATQYLSIWGAQQYLSNIIEIGGQLENQRRAITAILGEAAYANDLFGKIQNLALQSPFGVVELDQYSKQLSAYGFQYNELYDTTKRLADIAAGTGTDFSRITLALGHVRSEMALTGYTLRQFAMANIPMLRELSLRFSELEGRYVSGSEVRKRISTKEVTYDDVMAVLNKLTNEGGMFYNMQEVISESVKSRWKNLHDAMNVMYGQMAEGLPGDILKETAKALTELAKRWQMILPVITSAVSVISMYKVAQMAVNRGMLVNRTALMQTLMSYKSVSAQQVLNIATSGQLTRQQLIEAVATKKLTYEQAELAAGYYGVNLQMLKNISTMSKGRLAMQGFGSMLGKLLNPAVLAMIATEAVVGVYSAINAWEDKIKSEIDTVVDSAKAGAKQLREYLQDNNETPELESSMRAANEEMTTLLKNAGAWTQETEDLVGQTKSVREEYDVLTAQMEKGADTLSSMTAKTQEMANAIEATSAHFNGWFDKILAAINVLSPTVMAGQKWISDITGFETPGAKAYDFLFNDDIIKNSQELEKSLSRYHEVMTTLKDFQPQMQSVANQIASNFKDMHILAGKSLEEQIEIIANSRHWDYFYDRMVDSDKEFAKFAKSLRKSAQQVKEDWGEIVTDDMPKLVKKFAEENGYSLDAFNEAAKRNPQILEGMILELEKILDEKGPHVAAKIRAMIRGEVFGEGNTKYWMLFTPYQRPLTPEEQREKAKREEEARQNTARRDMGSFMAKATQDLGRINSTITPTYLNKYFGSKISSHDTESNVLSAYDKLQEELKSAKKIGDTEAIAYATAESKRLKDIIDYFGFKKEKKNGNGSGSYHDEYAKRWDERIRIIKEAYGWYDKWEKKVGKESALEEVNAKYADIFREWREDKVLPLTFDVNNIEDYQRYIEEIRDLALERYHEQMNDPAKNNGQEAERVYRQAVAVLNDIKFDDFTRQAEEYKSEVTKILDELIRRWDVYAKTLSSTGNKSLSQALAGFYMSDALVNTPAEAMRNEIEEMLREIGGKELVDRTMFSTLLDKDGVRSMFEQIVPDGVKEKIDGLIEAYLRWQKTEQGQQQKDIEHHAQVLGSLVDLQTRLNKLNDEYRQNEEEITRLLYNRTITEQQAQQRRTLNTLNYQSGMFRASTAYHNPYNDSLGMAQSAFVDAYNEEFHYLNQEMKLGKITIEDYADKVSKLNKIAQEFNQSGFLGIKGGVGSFLGGGIEGLLDYYRHRENIDRKDGVSEDENVWRKRRENIEKEMDSAKKLTQAFQDLSGVSNMLGNMFDALGMTGAANAFTDAGAILGGVASGASSLASLGPWGMAAGAAIGGITSFAQVHDKRLERQIEKLREDVKDIDATLGLIRNMRERQFGYDNGNLRNQLAAQYTGEIKTIRWAGTDLLAPQSAAQSAMYKWYGSGKDISGYAQELEQLKQKRQDYINMYNAEYDKKKSSSQALLEYREQIAELDEEIMYFGQDLAKELWSIDIKSWADQINDALMNAFENGENAAEAYKDTVRSIMQQVTSQLLKLGILEPMMERLNRKLFGYTDEAGATHAGVVSTDELVANPTKAAEKLTLAANEYFSKEGNAMITAAKEFYMGVNNALEQGGLIGGLFNQDKSNTLSAKTQGTTEETSDLLAAYVNALRQDVSANRIYFSQFIMELWPSYVEQVRAGMTSLNNIDRNTEAIRVLLSENGALYNIIDSMRRHFDNITNGGEHVYMR